VAELFVCDNFEPLLYIFSVTITVAFLGVSSWPQFLYTILQIKYMKNINLLLFLFFAFVMTSCEAIGDIFGAGVYVGVFLVIFVIIVIWLIIKRIFKR